MKKLFVLFSFLLMMCSGYDEIDYKGKYIPGLGWDLWEETSTISCKSDVTIDINDSDLDCNKLGESEKEVDIFNAGVLETYIRRCNQDFFQYDKNMWLPYKIDADNNLITLGDGKEWNFDVTNDYLILEQNGKSPYGYFYMKQIHKKLLRFKEDILDMSKDQD